MPVILTAEQQYSLIRASGTDQLVRDGVCLLCNRLLNPFDAGLRIAPGNHWRAHARAHYDASAELILAQEALLRLRGVDELLGYSARVQDVVREVFGFPPCSNTAIAFWREHPRPLRAQAPR